MYLAHKEGLLLWRPKYQSLYCTFNMSRYLQNKELEDIVSKMLGADDDDDYDERKVISVRDIRQCSVSVTRISPPKRH